MILVFGLNIYQTLPVQAATPSNPLLAESSLLLRSSTLSNSWVDGDIWENEGTAGSALNAISTATSSNPHESKASAVYVPNSGNQSAGIKTPFPLVPPIKNTYGFYIPRPLNSHFYDIPDTTGGLTVIDAMVGVYSTGARVASTIKRTATERPTACETASSRSLM